jgi:hypothetical protein
MPDTRFALQHVDTCDMAVDNQLQQATSSNAIRNSGSEENQRLA